jgi:hypothetical protein
MQFLDVNLLAVLAAAVANLIVGVIWYSPALFAGRWSKLTGRKGGLKTGLFEYGVSAAAALASAYVLALFIGASGSGTLVDGAVAGALAGVCLVASSIAVNYAFENRPTQLYLLTAGHHTAAFIIMGAVIGGLS